MVQRSESRLAGVPPRRATNGAKSVHSAKHISRRQINRHCSRMTPKENKWVRDDPPNKPGRCSHKVRFSSMFMATKHGAGPTTHNDFDLARELGNEFPHRSCCARQAAGGEQRVLVPRAQQQPRDPVSHLHSRRAFHFALGTYYEYLTTLRGPCLDQACVHACVRAYEYTLHDL